jgi:hypothetical protein
MRRGRGCHHERSLPDAQFRGFGDRREDYDAGRPDWPDWVVDELPGARVLELGAGPADSRRRALT